MPDNSERIAEIQTLLQSGVSSVVIDGVTVMLNHDTLRRELLNLQRSDNVQRVRRPVLSSIDLSGCF